MSVTDMTETTRVVDLKPSLQSATQEERQCGLGDSKPLFNRATSTPARAVVVVLQPTLILLGDIRLPGNRSPSLNSLIFSQYAFMSFII